jgi:hypothetical protein
VAQMSEAAAKLSIEGILANRIIPAHPECARWLRAMGFRGILFASLEAPFNEARIRVAIEAS